MSLSAPRKIVSHQPRRLGPALIAFFSPFAVLSALGQFAQGHSGLVDGYGCHRAADRVSYHCHEGEFVGRTFKSKEDFLRQLRQGRSEQLSPRSNAPQPPATQKKVED